MGHGSIPRDVSGLSVSVSVGVLVVLMENWGLHHSPVVGRVPGHWVGGHLSGQVQVEEVWVVQQRLVEVGVVLENHGSVLKESSAQSSQNEEGDIAVHNPRSDVEALHWELSNEEQSEGDSHLGSGGVVGEVEVTLVSWSGDQIVHSVPRDPRFGLFAH